jgi:hypothetical protein
MGFKTTPIRLFLLQKHLRSTDAVLFPCWIRSSSNLGFAAKKNFNVFAFFTLTGVAVGRERLFQARGAPLHEGVVDMTPCFDALG